MSDDDITEDKSSRRVERSNGIGCWPPPSPDTEDLSEPGMFVSKDHRVINWQGENYYQSCGEFVSRTEDGGNSGCVKPIDHPGHIHEDYLGRTTDDWNLNLGVKGLEEAVGVALGAASSCWTNLSGAGEFNGTMCASISEQLIKRIRQAGPIYD